MRIEEQYCNSAKAERNESTTTSCENVISEPERVAEPHGLCILLAMTEAGTEKRVEFASPQLVESKEE